MAEEDKTSPERSGGGAEAEAEAEEGKKKKPGKWIGLVPPDQLTSPSGLIAFVCAVGIEIIDIVLIPSGIDLLIEALIYTVFAAFIAMLTGQDWKKAIKGQIVPIAVGLVPGLSEVVPEAILYNWILPFFI